jgi:hypothetical protein
LNKSKKGAIIMARIKIKDISKDKKINKDELKRIRGGAVLANYDLKYDGINYSNPFDAKIEPAKFFIKVTY